MPSAKAKAKSSSKVHNYIKIAINQEKKSRRRRRKRTSHSHSPAKPQQSPQVVVVTAPSAPPDPYKREQQVQLSALESNMENAIRTRRQNNLAGRALGRGDPPQPQPQPQTPPPPQNDLAQEQPQRQSLLRSAMNNLMKRMTPAKPPADATRPTAQRPSLLETPQAPQAPRANRRVSRGTLDLFGQPQYSPVSQQESPPPNTVWRTDQATQAQLAPTERRTSPPLSPGEAMDMASRNQLEFIIDNLIYAPRNKDDTDLGQIVYTVPYIQSLRNPNTLRSIYDATRQNQANGRARRRPIGEIERFFATPPPPAPRDRRREEMGGSGFILND